MRFEILNDKEYELIERLGGNATHATYLARQVNLGRYVAIRALRADRPRGNQRFANELASMSAFTHPNNRRIVDAGSATIDDISGPYVVFDYQYATTLAATLEQTEELQTAEVLRIARHLLGALAEAHRLGVVHRQLSPAALLVCQHHGQPDHIVVSEFALEHTLAPGPWYDALRADPDASAFAAPELLRGEPPSVRSDLFSVGAILYRCAVGMAFSALADTDVDVIAPAYDRLAELKLDLIQAIDRSLALDPEQRYGSASDFLDALDPIFRNAHAAARVPSMSSFVQRPVVAAKPDVRDDPSALLSEEPSIWILGNDPAIDEPLVGRMRTLAAHYDVAVLDEDDLGPSADAVQRGEMKQPWVVVFGDLHVIMHNDLLGLVRDMSITRRLLVSAQLNAQMLEAAVNFCGVDRHVVRPISDEDLAEQIEHLIADCRRQLLRHEALRHMPATHSRVRKRQSLTGTFAAETR